ncbi:MAG: uroporphyrinogen decarboxylase [Pseudomonadota bacterium]
MKNDLFLRALRGEPLERTPIWIMRQAGRYLPEYRQTRQKAGDFLQLCKNPELACEVTMQPLERFDLDAAILFSDILTIPDAMGLGLHFVEGEGPQFHRPLNTPEDFKKLSVPNIEETLGYVTQAVRVIKKELNNRLPLIGFSGSPWTLATYMIEGKGTREFKKVKKLLYQNPEAFKELLRLLADAVTEYLRAQIDAGVDAVQIFDTWGGQLSAQTYKNGSLWSMQLVMDALTQSHPHIPKILFTKGGAHWLPIISQTNAQALGLDWSADLPNVIKYLSALPAHQKKAIQGNLDPAVMLCTPDVIRREAEAILQAVGTYTGHIFNLGHGITPDVPPDNLKVLVDYVHERSQAIRSSS